MQRHHDNNHGHRRDDRGHRHDRGHGDRNRGHGGDRGRGHNGDRNRGHGGERSERITRTYQADMIIVQVSVDPGDIDVSATPAARTRGKNASTSASAASVSAASTGWSVEFEPTEETLNTAKDALGEIGKAETAGKSREYLRFRGTIDVYADLRREILRIGGEKNASNAFLKYYEIAYYFLQPMVFTPGQRIVAFFNAELPGSSMVSFNHYFRTIRPDIDYVWYASSLWSTEMVDGSMGLGDKYGYVAHNRDKWLMSDTNNGDMTSVENILDIAARIGPRSATGGVDIYSHDAGINVSGEDSGEARYDVQEDSNMWLHLGCALSGFLTLRTGPNTLFIAKQYTFYRTFTWQLIMLYASLFERFYVTKPLTSRPTNSEIYLIGIGFRGCPPNISAWMIQRLKDRDDSPFIPEARARILPALGALRRFSRIVYGQQRDMLLEIVRLHGAYTADQIVSGTYELKRQLISRWLAKHPVKPISPMDRVPSA